MAVLEGTATDARTSGRKSALPATIFPTSTGRRLTAIAALEPESVAFVDNTGAVVRWCDVCTAAEAWLNRFAHRDTGTRVGIAASSGAVFAREILAGLSAGVTVVPLEAKSSDPELLWAAASSGLTHIVNRDGELLELSRSRAWRRPGSGREVESVQLTGDFPISEVGGRGRHWHPSVAPIDDTLPAEPALVCTTSGRTGPPKLVAFDEAQLLFAAERTAIDLRLTALDRGHVTSPVHRADTIVTAILTTLFSGGSTVFFAFDRRNFWESVDRTGSTWLGLGPAMIAALADFEVPPDGVCERLRYVRVAGGGVPLALHAKFWQLTGFPLLETYTMAEVVGPAAAAPLSLGRRRAGSAGVVSPACAGEASISNPNCPGIELRVVGHDGKRLPAGEQGRVQLRGFTLARDYLSYGQGSDRQPLIASRPPAQRDHPAGAGGGWFDTGDLGFVSADGFVFVVGPDAVPSEGQPALAA